jgi:hypothetical protein
LNLKVISIKDNDSLAARLAAEVDADLLILMSDVDGIYTCPPSEEGARLINTYCPHNAANIQFGKKSRVGLGGMDSKVCKLSGHIFIHCVFYQLHLHRYDLRAGHWKKEFQLSYVTEWLKMPSVTLSAAGNWELFLPIPRTAASARKRQPNKVHFKKKKNTIFQVSSFKK